jgi:hypothetical protein
MLRSPSSVSCDIGLSITVLAVLLLKRLIALTPLPLLAVVVVVVVVAAVCSSGSFDSSTGVVRNGTRDMVS